MKSSDRRTIAKRFLRSERRIENQDFTDDERTRLRAIALRVWDAICLEGHALEHLAVLRRDQVLNLVLDGDRMEGIDDSELLQRFRELPHTRQKTLLRPAFRR